MSSKQLKTVLRQKKLPVSGPKQHLIERLTRPDWRKRQKKYSPPKVQNNNDEWITDSQVLTFLGVPVLAVLAFAMAAYLYDEIFYYDNVGLGFQVLGICSSLLIILIVFLALASSDSMIEAAAWAWLMLTVLGAILSIIVYLILF